MLLELNCLRYTTDDKEKIEYLKSIGATHIDSPYTKNDNDGSDTEFDDYDNMRIDELKKLAKKRGIDSYLDMKKTELIKSLRGV